MVSVRIVCPSCMLSAHGVHRGVLRAQGVTTVRSVCDYCVLSAQCVLSALCVLIVLSAHCDVLYTLRPLHGTGYG